MKENVLDVLMYMFDNFMEDDSAFDADQETLSSELALAGFQRAEIDKAFAWLEDLSVMCEDGQGFVPSSAQHALRHYTPAEQDKLSQALRGFVLFLEQRGILDPVTRETVIDRVMALDTEEIDLEQLRWVIMMVLYNQPGREGSYAWMEDMVYDEVTHHLH
jgi:Smg protein